MALAGMTPSWISDPECHAWFMGQRFVAPALDLFVITYHSPGTSGKVARDLHVVEVGLPPRCAPTATMAQDTDPAGTAAAAGAHCGSRAPIHDAILPTANGWRSGYRDSLWLGAVLGAGTVPSF